MGTTNTIANRGKRRLIAGLSFTLSILLSYPVLAESNSDYVEQLLRSGRLAYADGNYIQAEHDYSLAVDESHMNGSSGEQMVLGYGDLGSVLLAEGRYAEAEVRLNRAIAILKADESVDRTQLPVLMGNLGKVYQRMGRYSQSESTLTQALKLSRQFLADRPLYTADLQNSLGVLHFGMGNIKQAEQDFEKAMALTQGNADDPHWAPILSNLATMYFVQQKWSLAEDSLVRSIRIVEKARGLDHPDLCPLLDNAGYIFFQKHELTQAETTLRRSLAIRQRSMGTDNPYTAATATSLAKVLAARGAYEEAGQLYADALKTQEKVFGLQSQEVARSLDGYAYVLHHTHNDVQADNMEARAESIRLMLSYTVSVKDLHR